MVVRGILMYMQLFIDEQSSKSLKNYLYLLRIDHWFKNIFMLPGAALAIVLSDITLIDAIEPLLIGILSVCLIASANYVINEWLDAEFDRFHPVKKNRPSALGDIQGRYVCLLYFIVATLGFILASSLSNEFQLVAIFLLVMGVFYNVRPFRTKDRIYLDVLSESINNPLRFLLGWYALTSGSLPPSSILLAYWMGGAFLMAVKRYAEFRFIDNPEQAGLYRRSFRFYTEEKLLLSAFFYALSSALFLGVFLIKYRIEFLLSFPLFALLFVWYLHIGMKPHSPTQNPEKLYQEKKFVTFVCVLSLSIAALFVLDLPFLNILTESVKY